MRKILHADCDCFYAAVEMRDDPRLRDIPIAIGRSREHRGVIATCNYPARAYGIHSAMPTARALQLCPHLTLLPGDFDKYREVSRQIQAVFHELTPLVEPLSLDEAYLDVSEVTRFEGSATWMAEWLKRECLARTGITVSVGVAPAKFLAKVASDWDKPDGLTVIPPERVEAFVARLPVNKLHGVGPATGARLEALGIHDCSDLRRLPLERLVNEFGKFGHRLYELARGVDERPVKVERERKSVSVETTFDRDLPDLAQAREALAPLHERLRARLQRQGSPAIAGIFVKVRFDDFSLTTLESRGQAAEPDNFERLLAQAWARAERPVRLLGVGVRLPPEAARQQLSLPL
ncbi:DNA polymerase IV [Halomonas koreensis]|uniref:DNA polymerase IV n=1 Tax=Halomonas koreensis TaxID=245385 RepID=A0ABU1FZA2_9GAMM|nr:DNA polymerase IV [Halomonas koreensis]MDR5865959.1 DNA polymerase IV [Halomonas koreensis]